MSAVMLASMHDYPSPVGIELADGACGAVIVCDHASCDIPAEYSGLGLTSADRQRHIGWDIGALGLARSLSKRLNSPLVYATLSRLLLDVNRSPEAHDAIVERSEDTIIPGNLAISAFEREQRRSWIYTPYHDAIETILRTRMMRGQPVCVVAIHSFTPVYRGRARPWHVGVLSNRDRRMAESLLSNLHTESSLVVGDNLPYAPTDGVYHTLERHAEAHGLPCVMLEVRNDLIDDVPGQEAWAERLTPLLLQAFESAVAVDRSKTGAYGVF